MAQAQQTDTLPTVQVESGSVSQRATAVQPLQQLNKKDLLLYADRSVADAAKQFSGLLVNDYGGIGGLKTVSVRSLGAAHTALLYDGIVLSNSESGQVDLGKISTANLERIRLYNGHPEELLLPAQAFASASVLQLQSDRRTSMPEKKWGLQSGLQTGSLGFLQADLDLQHFFNKRLSHNVSLQHIRSHGEYKYQSYEQRDETDKRLNSDVQSLRLAYDIRWALNDSNELFFKSSYYNSERGLPGAVIFFNPDNGDRLKNENVFMHLRWRKQLSNTSRFLLQSLYDYAYTHYVDPEFNNAQGKLLNTFLQNRYYISAALQYDITDFLSASWSTDYSIQTLQRKDSFATGFATPTRYTLLQNIALKAAGEKFAAQANLLYNHVRNTVKMGNSPADKNIFSPTLSVGFSPSATSPWHIRSFYKKVFRLPSFNDLYYTLVGNTTLKPEYATQINLGATYKWTTENFFENILLTTDVYYNTMRDKILALPRQNLFQWSMVNMGKVEIKGLDFTAQFVMQPSESLQLDAKFVYTYQSALNKTDKSADTYNTQIPYTPIHSGSLLLHASYKQFSASAGLLFSDSRYRQGDPIPDNFLPAWATQDLMLQYNWVSQNKFSYRISLAVTNLFNTQYEIIRYYPMPGTQLKIGFHIHI